jgi:leader peptidase (prepilin peptidase) / N-methyltransferase
VTLVLVFLFGLLLGSFLNVCIRRIPGGESIITPPSHCPHCGAQIRPIDNIPLLSYLLLRGHCRGCGARISVMYPAVELLTATLALACYFYFGLSPDFAKWLSFCAINLVLIFTDLRERILPDTVNFFGLAVGLLASLFVNIRTIGHTHVSITFGVVSLGLAHPATGSIWWRMYSLEAALLGAACGGGALWLFAEGYFRLRHREGMGLGDVKMMLMAGSFLGWQGVLLTILAGSVMGSVIGLLFITAGKRGRDYQWPFGTFLGIAAIGAIFWGPRIITWYFSFY